MNVSDLLMDELYLQGVRCVFFVAGGNAMYLNEALRVSEIASVPTHHEQTAAMAAEAYSRISGKIGGCLATSGPGVSNLVTGLAGAFLDSVPLVAIGGQAKAALTAEARSDYLRQAGLFEVDNEQIVRGVVKGFFRLDPAQSIRELVRDALALATSGRPGPVFLEVPLEIQGMAVAEPRLKSDGELGGKSAQGGGPDVLRMSQLELSAAKPLILAGNGVLAANCRQDFLALVEKYDIPFVTTHLAKGIAPFDHRLFVGHPGPRGDRAGNHAIQSSDLLFTIGTSLGNQTIGYEQSLFAPRSRKIIQDFGEGVSGKRLKISEAEYFNISVRDFISELDQALGARETTELSPGWCDELLHRKFATSVISEPHLRNLTGHNMYDFADLLSGHLAGFLARTAVVTDAGLAFYVMGQTFRLSESQTYTVSGGLGAMGYALPAVIGQSQLDPELLVVGVSGDGSTQMNVQEFATLAALNANAVFFVLNNEGYASIRKTQGSFFGNLIGSSSGTGVKMPEWAKIAEAYGIFYSKIAPEDSLKKQIGIALGAPRPRLVEVICQPLQELMPVVPNYFDDSGMLRSKPLDQMDPSTDGARADKIVN